MEDQKKLPDYGSPPVVETVVGVQFKALPMMTNAHLGVFWQSLGREEWPTVVDAPPLPGQEERFSPEAHWGKAFRLQLTQSPSSRIRITNRDGTRMIQLQNGRLHLNWLGAGGDQYPRYHTVRAEFIRCLRRLLEFVQSAELGSVEADQWEVTYVNHIPRSSVWESPADWNFFKPLNGVPTIDGLIEAESFSGEWHFVIPGQRGRLHARWQHAHPGGGQGAELIRLDLTARGAVARSSDVETSIICGLDLGHSTIVRSFRHLMSDRANQEWKLKNVGSP